MAGATRQVAAANMGKPFVMGTNSGTPRLDAIRSFTIGNLTSDTTVTVYMGQGANGSQIFQVSPGSNVTMPVEETQWLTFTFTTTGLFDKYVYLHVDSDALAASGFQFPAQGLPLLGPSGYSYMLGGGLKQWGTVTLPVDNSQYVTTTFPLPFTSQIFGILTGIFDPFEQIHGYQLSARYFNPTLTQASFVLSGGPFTPNPTSEYFANIFWEATGV